MESSNSLAPAEPACSRETLNRYVAGTLGADALLEFLFHVDFCPKCWQTLYEIRRAADRKLYKRQSGVAIPDPVNYAATPSSKPDLVEDNQVHPPALTAFPSQEHDPAVLEEVHLYPAVFGAQFTLDDVPIREMDEVKAPVEAPEVLPIGPEMTFEFPDGVAREVKSTPTRKRVMKTPLELVEDDVIIRRLEEDIVLQCEELDRLEKDFRASEVKKHALEQDLEALRRSAEVRQRYVKALGTPVSFRRARQKLTRRPQGPKVQGGKWTEPILTALAEGDLSTPEIYARLRQSQPDLVHNRDIIYQALNRMEAKGLIRKTERRGGSGKPLIWTKTQTEDAKTA